MTVAPQVVGPSTSSGGPASSRRAGSLGDPLTDRQLRTLQLAAEGLTHRQIARELVIAEKSVSYLVSEVLVRLGAHNITHAVFLACQTGILEPGRRHGDHAGFAAHRYRGEEPCEACWEGERAYRRGLRAARKASKTSAKRTS